MAVSGTRRSIAARKFARNRVWHTLGSVRKQSQRTIAFHYIDLHAVAVTGTRALLSGEGLEGVLSRQLLLARPPSSSLGSPLSFAFARSRVLRSPPSFPFPPPINNFIRRSREREAVINYRAARRWLANLSRSKNAVPISTFSVLAELSKNRQAANDGSA